MENYLLSVCDFISDLSRFCISCVTNYEFTQPIEIRDFVQKIYFGFLQMNFKKDNLRRKFDG
jgi:predicted translin family RNA/ssDNA-binding protein